METLYQDALACIARWLEPWDLNAVSRVCKAWYRVLRRKEFRMLISFPFKPRYKLTSDQFVTLGQMMKNSHKFKLVHGEVGSGKTWLATSYVLRTYGEWLKCSAKQESIMYVLVVVPPTCISQWSEFFLKYTDLPVLSNYESSAFYVDDWQKQLHRYGIIICSNLTSGRIQSLLGQKPHVILHDEAHNGITASYAEAEEVVGFTASIETFYRLVDMARTSWKVFELRADALNTSIPPIEFVTYEPCGYRVEDGVSAAHQISGAKNLTAETIDSVIQTLSTGFYDLPPFGFNAQGVKYLYFRNRYADDPEQQGKFISVALNVPKFRQVVLVAELVKKRGEKLIIFDINQDYIVPLACLLEHFKFKVYPFCTQYNPAGRAKQLKKFCTEGDVLIGSIAMLSEGHNIVEANNILFFRYPKEPEAFLQAFGRCHRYPQKKTVFVHLIWTCALERSWALTGMNDGYSNLRAKNYRDELAEFYALVPEIALPPQPITVRRIHPISPPAGFSLGGLFGFK